MNKESLESKIIKALESEQNQSMGLWSLADKIWDNCMQKPQPGNGARIASLRRTAEKSQVLDYYVNSHSAGVIMINKSKFSRFATSGK